MSRKPKAKVIDLAAHRRQPCDVSPFIRHLEARMAWRRKTGAKPSSLVADICPNCALALATELSDLSSAITEDVLSIHQST